MKYIILSLLFLASCASNRTQPRPKYDKDLVCSLAALEYLNSPRKPVKGAKVANSALYDSGLIRAEINKMVPGVRKCYDAELANPAVTFKELNLCYVVGTDAKGTIEFSNFYNNEEVLSDSFLKCLNDKKNLPDLKQFKSVKISQPFTLTPVN